MNSYLAAMRKYATIHGRTSRYDYWMYTLCFAGLMFVAFIFEGILGLGSNDVRPLMGLVSIGHLAPNVAITARRLHDQDRTAWWLLLWLTGIGTIVTFIFTLMPGTRSANRFGPASVQLAGDQAPEALQYSSPSLAQPSASSGDVTQEIERLVTLRANGSLSDDEFQMMKSRLLSRRA